MGKDPRREQRAALKRKKREQRVREEKSLHRGASQGGGQEGLLSRAKEFPVGECVVSKGWQERGLAHILVTRRAPDGTLVVGGYYVDPLCTGLKATAVMPRLSEEEYRERVKPHIFNDPVEFEACEPGRAKALVEGAVQYAGSLGLKPAKRWEEARRVLEGIDADGEGLVFGRGGKPCLVLRGGEKAPGVQARLDRTLGPGNYAVEEIPAQG
ncbi:MAG: hypothetical protein AB1578_16190 [Thermodesulfobacteriota bacterium]